MTLQAFVLLASVCCTGQSVRPAESAPWIGYTELRTDRPGGRQANVATMRAMLIRADGSGRHELVPSLARDPDTWTQFAGWSPDGGMAVVGRGWESPENARWEEEHREFHFTAAGWLYDMVLVDVATGQVTNVTAVQRVSFYNTGLFFWLGDPDRLGFQSLIDGNSHPFSTDRSGRHKRDLTAGSKEFAYGFEASPDGRRIAYHKSYQVYLADADGSKARRVETGRPFNFAPQWSPDGKHVLFLSGEHYDCHPHVVNADGSGLHKLADRNGYKGVIAFLDVPDFHGGSSDVPAWSADGASVFFTAQAGPNVELFRVGLDSASEQLTRTSPGSLQYHPHPSRDGRLVLFGAMRDGVRQLHVMDLLDRSERRITDLTRGHAAMWPYWQPR
jgi:TolB protein